MAEELLVDADSEIITDSEGENLTVFAVSVLEDSLSLSLVKTITSSSEVGTIYYVDATGGLDSNSGLATDEAWQTITKVNGETFNPGDRILFKRGETFVGTLSPSDSGVSGNVITYGIYGTGDRPIIDGSAARALDIDAATASFLRFENIVFSGATGATVSTVRCNTHDVYFYNCAFNDSAAWMGFGAFSASGSIIYNITLDTCTATNNYASGIFAGSDTGVSGPHDVLITNCTTYSNGTSTTADHGIYVKFGCIVDNCTSFSNASAGIKVNCQTVHDSPYYPIVRNCTSYLNRVGIYMGHEAAIVHNNLVYSNTNYSMQFDSDGDNCLIYFNTFVNVTAPTGARGIIINGVISTGNTFKNNLIIQDSAVVTRECMMSADNTDLANVAANNTFDYNVYYWNGSPTGHMFWDDLSDTFKDWTEWQAYAASPDPNGTLLTTTPDFVIRYTDLHPADAGDLKGLGVAILGYGTDKEGVTRADPPTPGCFETTGIVIEGSTVWGHITGATETNIRTFVNNWSGTGAISDVADEEKICMDSGEYMISEVVETGATAITLLYDTYRTGTFAGTLIMQYRHGSTQANCEAAGWQTYTVPFTSDGFVQVRIEAP